MRKIHREKHTYGAPVDVLAEYFRTYHRPLVLTGAGCSTGSGIPDYRDRYGNWKHNPPVLYSDFVKSETTRKRYWARSMHGWPRIRNAEPNPAHRALARLESAGYLSRIVTQNVDGLHQKAGNTRVIDLHGKLDSVICIDCGGRAGRDEIQNILQLCNPSFINTVTAIAPDGDANLTTTNYHLFRFPDCPECGGIYKPDVTFFGEFIPQQRLSTAMKALADADCLIVVGSSLMVLSGYRFCREALRQGKPVISINIGRSRGDNEFLVKIEEDCSTILAALVEKLDSP